MELTSDSQKARNPKLKAQKQIENTNNRMTKTAGDFGLAVAHLD